MDRPTDPRLTGIQPYLSHEAVCAETHACVKAMLETDYREFLKRPTQAHLACVVGLLLTYQESVLLGTRRKP
jgi:hypothetical protein